MKRLLLLCCALSVLACDPVKYFDKEKNEEHTPETTVGFAKGADLGWITEMESRGLKFYNKDGKATECTALFKELGFNAIRCRVWVNSAEGWCGREDVLVKAKRAKALGMDIMIDFHYSDWWADPGKQNVPSQ